MSLGWSLALRDSHCDCMGLVGLIRSLTRRWGGRAGSKWECDLRAALAIDHGSSGRHIASEGNFEAIEMRFGRR